MWVSPDIQTFYTLDLNVKNPFSGKFVVLDNNIAVNYWNIKLHFPLSFAPFEIFFIYQTLLKNWCLEINVKR